MTALTVVPAVLAPEEARALRDRLLAAPWVDGNATSGHQSALAKRNRQLPEEGGAARECGALVLDALGRSAEFVAAALPLKVYPPLFNRYAAGDAFGPHVDSAIRIRRGSDFRVRSDLSATLFLSAPEEYDGGALEIEGEPAPVRLAAGDMLLYPASTVHQVTPVTRGERISAFFWVQSMVRDGEDRRILLELDRAVQELSADLPAGDPRLVRLTGVYHNLLRRRAEV